MKNKSSLKTMRTVKILSFQFPKHNFTEIFGKKKRKQNYFLELCCNANWLYWIIHISYVDTYWVQLQESWQVKISVPDSKTKKCKL